MAQKAAQGQKPQSVVCVWGWQHPHSEGNYFLFERPAARSSEGVDVGLLRML